MTEDIEKVAFPVTYIPNFIPNSDMVFDDLWNQLDWERRTRRREYWTNEFNRPYSYSKNLGVRTYEARPTHPRIEEVKAALKVYLGFEYEGCFLNGYETNRDALGHHSDDDTGIDHDYPIAVVTVGQARKIEFMELATLKTGSQLLEGGSLLLMHAGMQQTHTHAIPKSGHNHMKSRVSLTFRKLK